MSRIPARAKRGPGTLAKVREQDPDGRIVLHHRVVDTLGRMLKSGTIDGPMHDAGRAFQRDFTMAQLDPLRAADLLRVPGSGCGAEPGQSLLAARRRMHEALAALGGPASPAGSVAWHVLGVGCSVREWALQLGWNGRVVRQEQARGVLLAVLGLLAAYYSLGRPQSKLKVARLVGPA